MNATTKKAIVMSVLAIARAMSAQCHKASVERAEKNHKAAVDKAKKHPAHKHLVAAVEAAGGKAACIQYSYHYGNTVDVNCRSGSLRLHVSVEIGDIEELPEIETPVFLGVPLRSDFEYTLRRKIQDHLDQQQVKALIQGKEFKADLKELLSQMGHPDAIKLLTV